MFERCRIHKQTWVSNDGVIRNQIDHVFVDARHGSNVTDVRSSRGIDPDIDHFLVRAKVHIRICIWKCIPLEKNVGWHTEAFIEDDTKFVYEIDKHLVNIDKTEVNHYWNTIEEEIIDSLKETVEVKPKCENRKKEMKPDNLWYRTKMS